MVNRFYYLRKEMFDSMVISPFLNLIMVNRFYYLRKEMFYLPKQCVQHVVFSVTWHQAYGIGSSTFFSLAARDLL